jgi:serine/threonine-protein kinase
MALTEHWDSIRALFEGALEQPAGARDSWLRQHCQNAEVRDEVASLIACHERPHGLLDSGVALAPASDTALPQHYRIGAYRIERLLGRGGMGAVYLAGRSDESFDRQVAIKIIGRSLDSADALRRFLAERQTLAGLDHPNIARLLDGGATPDRLPYFVMEYVDGEPIDKFCRTHSLGVEARLALFVRVASAVQHAHERLIVHRDLKPDNVLVRADGEPKLLDFGIAKTIARDESPLTTVNARAMTPRYASPEQIRGAAIGTSSDVYSLGVLLYEILTGQLPHGGGTESGWQVAREITDNEPVAPSAAAATSPIERQWAHRLRGDLDAIVLMALRKEPERRYRSVDQFADDIRHYQSGRPVVARPDTLGYRARKFVSRNRLTTAAASLAVLALLGGVIGATWQARVARHEARRAQAEAARAQRVSEFLKTVVTLPDPSWNAAGAGGRHDMTVLDLLKAAGERIDKELASDPEMASDLHHAIGNTYRARGMPNEALPHFTKALELRQRVLPPNDPKIAESLFYFGANQFWLGRLDVGEQYLERAIAIERTLPFDKAEQLPYMLLDLPSYPSYRDDWPRAELAIREAGELFARHLGADHMTVAFAKERLADLQLRRGDVAAAKALLGEELAMLRRKNVAPLDEAGALRLLANASEREGDLAEAERLSRETLARLNNAYGADHVATLESELHLSSILVREGRTAEARQRVDRILAVRRLQVDASPIKLDDVLKLSAEIHRR